jgi:hypothetical protein
VTNGVAELALEQQVAIGQHWDNDNRAGMNDTLSHPLGPIRQTHAIAADIEQLSAENLFGFQCFFVQMLHLRLHVKRPASAGPF